MYCILEKSTLKRLKSVFIYYFFKVKYLKNYFIDLDSVKSSEITVFSR